MNLVAAIIQKVLAALAAPLTWVFKAGEWVLEKSVNAVSGAFSLAGDAVDAVTALPGRVIRGVLGGGAAPAGPGPAPEQAAADEEEKQAQAAKQRADGRALVKAVRNIVSALAQDAKPDGADIARAGPDVFRYLSALSRDEQKTLADASAGALYEMFLVGTTIAGVRSQLRLLAEAQRQKPDLAKEEALAPSPPASPGVTRIFTARARRSGQALADQAPEDPALRRALSLCPA